MVGRRKFGAVGRRCGTVRRLQDDEAAITDADLAVTGDVRRPLDEERVESVHPAHIHLINTSRHTGTTRSKPETRPDPIRPD